MAHFSEYTERFNENYCYSCYYLNLIFNNAAFNYVKSTIVRRGGCSEFL